MKPVLLPLAVCAAFVLAGCASTSSTSRPTAAQLSSTSYETLYLGANGQVVSKTTQAGKKQDQGYWKGTGMTGSPSIVIDLSAQEAYFYKGGQLAGMSPVSTGREGYNTPTGSFRIMQKNPNHVSNLYGNFVDNSGDVVEANISSRDRAPAGAHFEGAPMPYFMRVTGAVGMHQGFLPGVPDSHGCIRMPKEMAQIFFENAPLGTPVRITH